MDIDERDHFQIHAMSIQGVLPIKKDLCKTTTLLEDSSGLVDRKAVSKQGCAPMFLASSAE